MTNSQHVGGKQRHRRQRQTRSPSPSDPHRWERTQQPALDSLPYRTPSRAADVDIQMPDSASRRTRHLASSSHRGRRASEDRETMPLPTRSHRPPPVTHRRGKEPQVYHDDDESDASPERRPRPRVRRRARSTSRSTSGSERASSRSETVVTPSRCARAKNHSTPNSRRSSRSASSRRASSVDSASTLSAETQSEVKEILRRPAADIQVIPDAEKPGRRHHHGRRHSEREPDSYEVVAKHRSRRVAADVRESRDAPRQRHRHQSESRSSSRRRPHQYHDRREETIKPSSSKRGPKKYYRSDASYVDGPKLLRSSSSQVTSSHSVSTSSRRSSTAISKFVFGSPKTVRLVECVACLDEEVQSTKAAKLKCKHYMCHSCMKRVFKVSIKDPQHMPPTCCTEDPIPVKHVDRLFDTSFKKMWNKKFAEYSTRNRIYCPSRRCGEWIKPNRIKKLRDGRKIAECGRCQQEVCCACNGKWHRAKDCPGDTATNEILEQAKEFGWQRCYGCKEMVELKEGCNHMTCRCGTEFCMICGAKWKSCECPWFNYETVDSDQLGHMNSPTHSRTERDRQPTRESRGHSRRERTPRAYDDELSLRRVQERRDEEYARQLQYEDDDDDNDDDDDDDDDDFTERYGDIVGVGNSAGHFMNDDYRRAPRVIPAAPSPPMQAVDRANAGDYVTGVNKARGVRASSMERRLADRFSDTRHGTSPTHRSFTTPISPPPPLGMGMAMGMGMGMGMSGMSSPPPPPPMSAPFMMPPRAHTMDEDMMYGSPDMYSSPPRSRLSERIAPGRGRADYEAEPTSYTYTVPRQRRERERERERDPPKDSALAGLTGPGSGMNRVHEWMNYVSGDSESRISAK